MVLVIGCPVSGSSLYTEVDNLEKEKKQKTDLSGSEWSILAGIGLSETGPFKNRMYLSVFRNEKSYTVTI
jgi:hypothetical protein